MGASPGLDAAGVHDLEVALAGTDDVGHIEVQVADAFEAPDNVPVNPATYIEEYGIPVVHLGVSPELNADAYTPATIVYRGHSFEGAEAKYRGAKSLTYPKKSFTLKFAKTDRFADTISVPGFSGKRKLTLTTTFDDNSYLIARFRSLLDGPWAAAAINESLDGWASEIRAAAQRDEQKWAAAYAAHFSARTDLTNFDQEIAYVRDWIVARHDFVATSTSSSPSSSARRCRTPSWGPSTKWVHPTSQARLTSQSRRSFRATKSSEARSLKPEA